MIRVSRIAKASLALSMILLLACTSATQKKQGYEADLIIYGGTAAAITAAVEAVNSGKTVIVVSPDKHLGGLSSGGLGFTDTGNKGVIGGLAREFYHRVYLHYQDSASWKWQKHSEYGNKGQGTPAIDGNSRTMWIFEPHTAEQIFEDFVKENKITVYRDEWLDRGEGGVHKQDGSIRSIKTLSGKIFKGKMFIDATYEGDLMASAGVRYHVGREANSMYNENYNGVQVGVLHHDHYFKKNISPYKIPGDSTSGLLYGISDLPPGKFGEGDKKVQAYCFRMALTNNPDNRVAFPKPANYKAANYELLARVFASGWRETFRKFDPIPNRKTDTNNHGPFSTDFIGMNYDYPDASYEERKKIIQAHTDYQQGLMYFLANDPKVPDDVRKEMAQWGLAKDEFTDNGNWPHQLYIREARRMIGQHVMTEHDTFSESSINDPVGMGSYTLDSHNTQRYVKPDGFVQNEGDIGVSPKKPYQISYGSITPKKDECKNLLVPVCVSSSHIAFGSIRMEPVFMILGQSAAAAAVLAIDADKAVQDIDYQQLKKVLESRKQVLAQ
ncbi:FAD dependent oxidoreductase [bacterium A37T11]|nr:FAD dependent oxidoreductase [bacterium A37T11]